MATALSPEDVESRLRARFGQDILAPVGTANAYDAMQLVALAIEKAGAADQRPFESYWVGFTIGSIIYTVDLHGPPGSVSEEQVQTIASAFHERLTAS